MVLSGSKPKTYADFMSEISPDELYDRLVLYGMFSEKLPPILSAVDFLNFCKTERSQAFSSKQWYNYISYENTRNTNVPRNLGIPTPMGHELLSKCLSENWTKIVSYFKKKTKGQSRIISRIHIRKMREVDALFEMNYKNWRVDGTPEPDIYMGKKYMVHADISKCYPSIYTHAIPWAIAGKSEGKKNATKEKIWYNKIDRSAQNSKNGETHGLLIGPHTSNILSEIILCAIDARLWKSYKHYIRNIDDYVCYADTQEEAEQFLIDLNRELREYGLLMNHKKTEILELPLCVSETWVHKIRAQMVFLQKGRSYVGYREIQAWVDFVVKLIKENSDNNSIWLYAIKSIKPLSLTKNAQEYLVKSMVSVAGLYPYLVPLLGVHVFKRYQVRSSQIGEYANMLFDKAVQRNNFEACSYAILYAVDSNCQLLSFNIRKIIASGDCILLLMALIYCKKYGLVGAVEKLKKCAKGIIERGEMERYWLFVYECVGSPSMKGDWSAMKKARVSFLKPEYR